MTSDRPTIVDFDPRKTLPTGHSDTEPMPEPEHQDTEPMPPPWLERDCIVPPAPRTETVEVAK